MAEVLKKARSKFVEKVTAPVLVDLLDDVFENSLLNEGEKEYVIEHFTNRKDRARSLIDMVRKKGDKGCWMLIEYIKERDENLHSNLGLDNIKQPETKKDVTWSNKLVPTSDFFWNEKHNDSEIYPVSKESIGCRVALLITNRNFENPAMTRKGAEVDEENMKDLLTSLGYEVVAHNDLTGKGIDEALCAFAKNGKLKQTDSVFIVIMSHGKRGIILGVNHSAEKPDEFPVDKIYERLSPQRCPALMNKPKIIIIQACRGASSGAVMVHDGVEPELIADDVPKDEPAETDKIVSDSLIYVHKEKDFISLLSTTPNNVAYRREDTGSFMIQYIMEVFNTHSKNVHIADLFTKVLRRFEDFPDDTKKQMGTIDRTTLTRPFYLFPGIE